MAKLALTLACGDYDRTRAIRTGEVQPDGAELNVVMARFHEFDVSELSVSTYTVLRGRGEPLVAIPVFPSQSFRHSSIFIRPDAGIREPRDLIGKRVGVPKYHMTAAVWIRGMLEDEYGVAPKDTHWFWRHTHDRLLAPLAESRAAWRLCTVARASLPARWTGPLARIRSARPLNVGPRRLSTCVDPA